MGSLVRMCAPSKGFPFDAYMRVYIREYNYTYFDNAERATSLQNINLLLLLHAALSRRHIYNIQ
jgi:hypothetical protein